LISRAYSINNDGRVSLLRNGARISFIPPANHMLWDRPLLCHETPKTAGLRTPAPVCAPSSELLRPYLFPPQRPMLSSRPGAANTAGITPPERRA
jgi:hypothetical protein